MQPGSIEAHTHTHGIHAYVEQEVKGAITHTHAYTHITTPGRDIVARKKIIIIKIKRHRRIKGIY